MLPYVRTNEQQRRAEAAARAVSGQRAEVLRLFSALNDLNRLAELQPALSRYADEIAYADDCGVEDLDQARVELATQGLRLLQQTLPLLQTIANCTLEIAGRRAVQVACAPMTQDFGGGVVRERPSEFTLPPGYEPSLKERAAAALGR
jgi:hypothetical protein